MHHRPRRRANRGSAADERSTSLDGGRQRGAGPRGRGLLDEPDDGRRLDTRTDALELAVRRGLTGGVGTGVGHAIGGRDTGCDAGAVGQWLGVACGHPLARRLRLGGHPIARYLGIPRAILKATGPTPTEGSSMEDELVASGRFVRIEAQGARSGLTRAVTVGFVDDETQPGSLLVAANSLGTAWALNLLEEPACQVRVGERSFDALAEPLEPADHARAIRRLILRYGTPAEGLGRGPSFRLRPVEEGTA